MKIKVKLRYPQLLPEVFEKGDWVDLRTPETICVYGPTAETLKKTTKGGTVVDRKRKVQFHAELVDLGISMELPKGYEAVVLPRSSTFSKWGVILANSQGVIDNSYCGPKDTWKFCLIGISDNTIPAFTRIAQFRIQLSQKATFWQKVKWFFSNGKIEFVQVDELENENRGGIGSTGH